MKDRRLLMILAAGMMALQACSFQGMAHHKNSGHMSEAPSPEPQRQTQNSEEYTHYGVNPFVDTSKDNLSTFSIDVDTAAYTIARRKLKEGVLPPKASVRAEEFVNFFPYAYAPPTGPLPFAVDLEAAPSPFGAPSGDDPSHLLVRVGVQGKKIPESQRKPAHLVFLVDTSGSMNSADKLGLAQRSLYLLVNQLKEGDTVAICTYAGSVREVLAPTGMGQRAEIHEAIENLVAGGSTAMADGLETAYKLAYKTLEPGHINRIIVLSDGDANVGASSHGQILARIKHYTQEGVTLSTIGFGMGNYKDTNMEQLANKGNGNYFYIDSLREARRVFVEQLGSTLEVIAKDVKIQVEFNPATVASYRLIGYENRDIADEDFRDDAVDAGEIGAGHRVTAVYEVRTTAARGELAKVHIRHKSPQGARASESTHILNSDRVASDFSSASRAFRLATTVAAFAEKLRGSEHAAHWRWSQIKGLGEESIGTGADERELIALIDTSMRLSKD